MPNRRLLEADRQKNEFLVQLAHELRNPLAAVRNAARILRINQITPDNVTWAGNMVERQVKHLTRLIDDLLDLSRINRNKLEPSHAEERPCMTSSMRPWRSALHSPTKEAIS